MATVLQGLVPMSGRDPHESGRTASTLELLFDLTFVVALGLAGNEYAHLLAEGDSGAALFGYGFIMFGIVWAWINYSWFASAYDNDDWLYRLATMLQMAGVVVFALGIPVFFDTLHHGHVDNRVLVAGYVVMRVAMLAQWLRAAKHDPIHRRACHTYAVTIVVAQLGWVALAWVNSSLAVFIAAALVLLVVEALGPVIAETRHGGTPWHAHHIAERYALLVIITLGEGVVGTIAALSSITTEHGWTTEAILVVAAGVGLTFGLWWAYFTVDFAGILHRRRAAAFPFGYLHYFIFVALSSAGAGLHLAGYLLAGETEVAPAMVVAAVAIPVVIFAVGMVVLVSVMTQHLNRRHTLMALAVTVVAVVAWWLAGRGLSTGWCLLLTSLAPFVYVVIHETRRLPAAGDPDLSEQGPHSVDA